MLSSRFFLTKNIDRVVTSSDKRESYVTFVDSWYEFLASEREMNMASEIGGLEGGERWVTDFLEIPVHKSY